LKDIENVFLRNTSCLSKIGCAILSTPFRNYSTYENNQINHIIIKKTASLQIKLSKQLIFLSALLRKIIPYFSEILIKNGTENADTKQES
jgi:hypothetical protein